MKITPVLGDERRQSAERLLAQQGEIAVGQGDLMQRLHALQVHQVELERQNETLRTALAEVEPDQRFADLYEYSPVSHFSIGPDSAIHLLNRAAAGLLGLPAGQLKGLQLAAYVAADSLSAFNVFLAAMFAGAQCEACEINFSPVGRASPIAVSIEAVSDVQAQVCNLSVTDITARKRTEDALREQKEFFRLIAENVDGFIAVLDSAGRRIYNSPSYASLLGEQNVSGSNSFADIHPADRERVEQAFSQTIATGHGQHLEYRFITVDGKLRYMESVGGVVRDNAGQVKYVVVVSHDITERKAADAKIHHLAFYDPLTQLPNRLTLNDRLQQAMASSKRSGRYGALLFIDLDNFKPVNDAHGHGAGDLLLIQTASRISRCVREMDTVARFGGDEFVVMLGELNVDFSPSMLEARQVAEKIRLAIAEPYFLEVTTGDGLCKKIEHRCTASLGVTLFLNHEHSQEEIIQLADAAMYRAKESGRDRICYAIGD